jgi:hypothetical protein
MKRQSNVGSSEHFMSFNAFKLLRPIDRSLNLQSMAWPKMVEESRATLSMIANKPGPIENGFVSQDIFHRQKNRIIRLGCSE